MAAALKIKVKVAALIEAIEARKAEKMLEIEARYRVKLDAYPAAVVDHAARVAEWEDQMVAYRAELGYLVPDGWNVTMPGASATPAYEGNG